MPSTVVHLALAGLIAAALLGRAFDGRALAVVLALVVIPDLDAFAGFVIPGSHRALLHTLLFPAAIAALVVYDTRVRSASWLDGRLAGNGPRVAWVGVLAIVFAGIGPDLVGAGANILYPIHDQFYAINGKLELSTQRGLVQTFVDLSPEATDGGGAAVGSTAEVHVSSGVDPTRGPEPENVDRIFPVARSGSELLLVVSSVVVVGAKLVENRLGDDRAE